MDTTNYPVYYLFDRDVLSNREGVSRSLLSELNASQNDSEEQNGLLLLSYPAIESFLISLNEENSFQRMFRLGKEEKEYVKKRGYSPATIDEESLLHATEEFLAYLENQGLLEKGGDVLGQMDKLGIRIFESERETYQKERCFHCFSQLVELLIDLGIVILD